VAVHEFAHACLAHLSIPRWLNEGLAVMVQTHITGLSYNQYDLDKMHDDLQGHASLWNERTIQDFWSGDSFSNTEENHLSYDLAYRCVGLLAKDEAAIRKFIPEANTTDAGEAAALKHYGKSLGLLIAEFLGQGDWSPKPDRWNR
jgi:hypothetical protein